MSQELKNAAKELASKGRFGDTMLVHMHPDEVAGIASLVPDGKLTINPETGLPEAFFFLPFLASLFGSGAAAAAPLAATAAAAAPAAAAAIPAATAATTGALGSGIAAGVNAAGTAASGLLGSAVKGIGSLFGAGTPAAAAAPAAAAPAASGIASALPAVGATATPALTSTAPVGMAATNALGKGLVKGIGGIMSDPMKMMQYGMIGSQLLGSLGKKGGGSKDDEKERKRDLSDLKYKGTVSPAPAGYNAGTMGEWNYFPSYNNGGLVKGYANGGPVDLQAQKPMDSYPLNGVPETPGMGGIASLGGLDTIPESPLPTSQVGSDFGGPPAAAGPQGQAESDKELISQTVAAIKGQVPDPQPIILAFVQEFGEDALNDLVQRVQMTGGDGQSDSVPAMIDGQVPAALSQGEYVIPADVVSGLGNGSTDAGAAQLDSMVGGVRNARTGNPNQPRAIDPASMMPRR